MVCSSEQLTGLSLCFCIDVIVCLRIYASKNPHISADSSIYIRRMSLQRFINRCS